MKYLHGHRNAATQPIACIVKPGLQCEKIIQFFVTLRREINRSYICSNISGFMQPIFENTHV